MKGSFVLEGWILSEEQSTMSTRILFNY